MSLLWTIAWGIVLGFFILFIIFAIIALISWLFFGRSFINGAKNTISSIPYGSLSFTPHNGSTNYSSAQSSYVR